MIALLTYLYFQLSRNIDPCQATTSVAAWKDLAASVGFDWRAYESAFEVRVHAAEFAAMPCGRDLGLVALDFDVDRAIGLVVAERVFARREDFARKIEVAYAARVAGEDRDVGRAARVRRNHHAVVAAPPIDVAGREFFRWCAGQRLAARQLLQHFSARTH